MSDNREEELPLETIGFIAWAKTVKGKYRYMIADRGASFPNCITWEDNPAFATIWPDSAYPHIYFDQLASMSPRSLMGKIFPALELAIAFDLTSEVGEFNVMFGVSPLKFMPNDQNGKTMRLETKLDPDGPQPALVTMLGEKQ